MVEVKLDGVLECRRRHRELDCVRIPASRRKRIDEPAAERVAAADAVHDVKLVFLREERLLRPCVVGI